MNAERLEGWEDRLLAVVTRAREEAYELGRFDCFRLACLVIEALTGIDRWPEFDGQYSTKREALAMLAAHGSNFTEAGNWFFGGEPVSWKLARRGDILELRLPDGSAHLVVCLGRTVGGLTDEGFKQFPTRICAHAWRVG